MNANGQPFNMLKNPLSSFLTRVVGKGKQINTHPIHDASGEVPNPIGVSTGFKGFWAFDGTTDEVQHLSGLGVLVADEPTAFPKMGAYPAIDLDGNVGHFSPERWIWADGDDGSEKLAELEAYAFKYFVWDGGYQENSWTQALSESMYKMLVPMFEGAEKPSWWDEGTSGPWNWNRYCEYRGWPTSSSLLAWRVKKNYFRHVCDRLLLAQNCWLETVGDYKGGVILRHGKDMRWHAPQTTRLSPFYGKTRGWTGPACDIKMPWKSRAEEKAKEIAERYDEDESDSDSESESGDMGNIQFHTLRYLDFIPLAIHQHPMSSESDAGHIPIYVHANPGKRQAYAEGIIEEYQTRIRNKLPRAWGIPENTPIYKIQFKTPREHVEGKRGRFIDEDIDDAKAAVKAGDGIIIIYWNEVPADENTEESAEKIFDECSLGYYWRLVDATGWVVDGQWLVKDTDDDGEYDRRMPRGEWVPYENIVNKLFYCGPVPLQWNTDWGGKIEEGGRKIWNPDGDAFVHGNRQYADYSETVGDGLKAQDKLSIPVGSAFDLMVIVEAWRFTQYVMKDQSDIPDYWRVVDETGDDVYPPDQDHPSEWRKRWSVNVIPGFFRRFGLQARIVKPIPPEDAREE